MLNKSGVKNSVECVSLTPGVISEDVPYPKSTWAWEHWKKASSRAGAYELADAWEDPNVCTDEGINHMLGAAFSNEAQKTWRIALFNDDYTPLITNTYQAPGYTETSNYDEVSRPLWQEAGVASKTITNSANRAYFTMNAAEYVYGGALVSASTKGDVTSGEVMYCSSKFSSYKDVDPEDILKVTITLSSADS